MGGQNTFQILLLNDANMLYGCNFEKIHFLSKIDTNTRVGRDRDTLWTKSINGIFIMLQMKVYGHNFF